MDLHCLLLCRRSWSKLSTQVRHTILLGDSRFGFRRHHLRFLRKCQANSPKAHSSLSLHQSRHQQGNPHNVAFFQSSRRRFSYLSCPGQVCSPSWQYPFLRRVGLAPSFVSTLERCFWVHPLASVYSLCLFRLAFARLCTCGSSVQSDVGA